MVGNMMEWWNNLKNNWIEYLLDWSLRVFIAIFLLLLLFGDLLLPKPEWLNLLAACLLLIILTNWGVKKWVQSKRKRID
jgi:hypothetical protein